MIPVWNQRFFITCCCHQQQQLKCEGSNFNQSSGCLLSQPISKPRLFERGRLFSKININCGTHKRLQFNRYFRTYLLETIVCKLHGNRLEIGIDIVIYSAETVIQVLSHQCLLTALYWCNVIQNIYDVIIFCVFSFLFKNMR